MIPKLTYLDPLLEEMAKKWPENRCVNVVCHGHSVPAGYFATPFVNTMHAYPHLLHCILKERFPFAVTNVIVTAIGGETAVQGCERFERDVLNHKPDLVTIDYSNNDRGYSLETAETAWKTMIEQALERDVKVILCTPTWENTYYAQNELWHLLCQHAEQVRKLADQYNVGLADSFEAFRRHVVEPEDLTKYLSHVNHPTEAGHRLVAEEIAKYFVER